MKYTVKELNNKTVSLRDYQVQKCLDKKEDLKIEYNKSIMIIPFEAIKKAGIKRGVQYKSKWGTKDYDLIDFYWTPANSKLDPMFTTSTIKLKPKGLF